MAEIRKQKVNKKYDLEELNIVEKKKSNVRKSAVKKQNTKVKDGKGFFFKLRVFFHEVREEFKRIHWPSKKEMFKYSVATICFVIFCAMFFYLIEVIFAFVQSLL